MEPLEAAFHPPAPKNWTDFENSRCIHIYPVSLHMALRCHMLTKAVQGWWTEGGNQKE